MKKGADTDIFSGRPTEEEAAKSKRVKEAGVKVSLKNKAEFLDIIQSDPGSQVIELIERLLIKRLEFLAKNDSEAKAYHNILKGLGYKAHIAKRAVEDLYLMQLKDKED